MASDALTLSERAELAVAFHVLTLLELSTRAKDEAEFHALLAPDEPGPSLRQLWERRRAEAVAQ